MFALQQNKKKQKFVKVSMKKKSKIAKLRENKMKRESAAKEYVYSNDITDACKVTCKICDKEVTMSSMSDHTIAVHCLFLKEYKEIYGDHKEKISRKIFHKCGICDKTLLLDVDEIDAHLKRSKHIRSTMQGLLITHKLARCVKIERTVKMEVKDEKANENTRKINFDNLSTIQLLREIDLVLGA